VVGQTQLSQGDTMKLLELRTAIDAMIAANPNTQSAPVVITISGADGVVEVTSIAITDDASSRVIDMVFTPL
jgi:hypothetical protein